jgi:hypothetical protein
LPQKFGPLQKIFGRPLTTHIMLTDMWQMSLIVR